MSSPGEMLCAGILPVNQMRDYIEPAYVISSRVPMHLLEAAYGMKIRRLLDFKDAPDRPPTPHEMLEAYCALKGYIIIIIIICISVSFIICMLALLLMPLAGLQFCRIRFCDTLVVIFFE
jgi:hypothetical protein